MNETLVSVSVPPLYGQVVVQDIGTGDLPEWGTGEEPAVATAHAVLVATRPDIEGDVEVEVLSGSNVDSLGLIVFDGDLSVDSAEIEVGSPLAGVVGRVALGRRGSFRIRVFVEPSDRPERVRILVSPTRFDPY